ncbi:MAG TPA: LCP family protein, partial [Anaerolineae bacterium]
MSIETIHPIVGRLNPLNWRITLCILLTLALALPQPVLAAPTPASAEPIPAAVVQLPAGTINIALLGVDKRPTKNFNNTDVIVIASINPDIPSVTLLSIPRDWPAYIPGVGTQKINTAFGIGGPDLFRKTMLHNFGLNIDYYAMVNFEGLVKAVDTLGGVDAIATCRLYHVFPKDPYYMGNTRVVTQQYVDTFTGDVWKVGQRVPTQTIDIPKAGVYTLNGLQALAFVRARYGVPGGDVDRGRREQRIVRALFSKAKQINAIPKFPQLLSQFQEYVKTDIPVDKLLYFVSIADRFDDMMIRSRFLDSGGANGAVLDTSATPGRGSTWEATIQQMLNVALNQRSNDGIPIEVWNGTNDPGFGTAAVDRLNELGFNVTDIKAADKLYAQTAVIDYNTTKKGSALPLLERTFGIRAANVDSQPTKDGPRYRIIIGSDFQTCYYDDTYVLALRDSSEITDVGVASSEPATPTLALTPTPLPDGTIVSTTETITEVVPAAPGSVVTNTGVNISVPLGDLVNVRSGPDVRYPVIGQLAQEESAPLTGQTDDGQWWQIDFKGKVGWVATDFVQVNGDATAVPTINAAPITQAIVPVHDVVNVRSG